MLSTICLFFIGGVYSTFDYLGYSTSGSTSKDGKKTAGAVRGLAEDGAAATDGVEVGGGSADSHQDQTNQLQRQGLGHESHPDLDLPSTVKGKGEDGERVRIELKLKAAVPDHAARAVDSANMVHHTQLDRASGLYTMVAEDIDGKTVNLSEYRGKVSLVVNVASKCGYTDSNYKGLKELYDKHGSAGFEVLAFPCNSFGQQEPDANAGIKEFASKQYGITFPLFAKVEVNGPNAHPIFKFLNDNVPNTDGLQGIWQAKWNFSKWLVDKQGMPVKHYDSVFDADELERDIAAELLRST